MNDLIDKKLAIALLEDNCGISHRTKQCLDNKYKEQQWYSKLSSFICTEEFAYNEIVYFLSHNWRQKANKSLLSELGL